MAVNISLTVVLVLTLIGATSGVKFWKGCRKHEGKFKFKLLAELEGEPFERFTFMKNGNELISGCSTTNQQIVGAGTAANPYWVEVTVDPSVNINLGDVDCGHVASGKSLTWTAKIAHRPDPPIENAVAWSTVHDFTCDFDDVPHVGPLGVILVTPPAPPVFQHVCNQGNGNLFLAVWITSGPVEYVAFRDATGQPLFADCSTSGNQMITGEGTSNPFFVEILVDTTVNLDVGTPNCGHTRVGNDLTWTVEVLQLPGITTVKQFTCVFQPPTTPVPPPPQSTPPALPPSQSTTVPTPPSTTHADPPPSQSTSVSPADVTFQHDCNQQSGNIFIPVWIISGGPVEYVAFRDATGQPLFSDCSTSTQTITGNGTSSDPFFVEIQVDTTVSLDVGTPNCGHTRIGNDLTWTVEVLQLPDISIVAHFTCVYEPSTTHADPPPTQSTSVPTPPPQSTTVSTQTTQSTSVSTPLGVIFQLGCAKERDLFVFHLYIDMNTLPLETMAFQNPTGEPLDCECGLGAGHFTGNGTQANPFYIRVQVSPTCNLNYGTPDCGHIANGNSLIWTLRIDHTFGIPGTSTVQPFTCHYDNVPANGQLWFPIF